MTARKVSSYFGDQAVRDNERNDGTSENYTHTKGDEDANLNNPIILTDGLYTDEERILQDGIEKTPSRYELREELLKIYAKRKDREKFKALFLRTMEKCPLEAPSKKRVLALIGRMIDPENPLYHSILNGETDPGAVADLYLASGRHIEAETVLIKAIGEDPRTYNIYVKLLKIYAER